MQLICNGEIYNHKALRHELEAAGHCFRTRCDIEVIVHLYEQYGVDMLRRLRGMFALALWDSRQRVLLLARDRFGKKPLYYSSLARGVYFASELDALRYTPVPFDIDSIALQLYFQFLFVPEPFTGFRAIQKLEPGTWMTIDSRGSLQHGRYWSVPVPLEDLGRVYKQSDIACLIKDKFDEAVRIRMSADVPVGAFLSGGIDSSSVVASMALQSATQVRTFSIGFDEPAYNELGYARMVAEKYGTDHHEMIVRPDAVQLAPNLIHHFGEPFADISAIPTYLVSQLARQYVKVVLSGDGGDELFAGYESVRKASRINWLNSIPADVRRLLAGVSGLLPFSAYGKNYLRMLSCDSPLLRYFEDNYVSSFLRRHVLEPQWLGPAEQGFLTREISHCLLPASHGIVAQILYFEATCKLTADMLVKVDRMAMANGLEVRSPFLDHELAELAAAIPPEWNLHRGQGKAILVKACGNRVPDELLKRPKMGFVVPLAYWLRGALREFLFDHLRSPQFLNRGIVRPRFLEVILEEHQRQRRDHSHWLWGLLMLELWFQHLERPRGIRSSASTFDSRSSRS